MAASHSASYGRTEGHVPFATAGDAFDNGHRLYLESTVGVSVNPIEYLYKRTESR
jgi:hypothetical protein